MCMSRSRSPLTASSALACAFALACGDGHAPGPEPEPEPDPFRLVLDGGDAAVPSSWVVVVHRAPDARDDVVVCPGALAGVFVCDAAALTFAADVAHGAGEPRALALTFKVAGFVYAHVDVARDDAERHGDAPVVLTPLAPTQTADFATGFGAGDAGRADFEALAATFVSELGTAQVVKFYLEGRGGAAPTVYFQDTVAHPLHFDFYRDVLGRSGTRSAFEAATYTGEDRPAAAGTLIVYPDVSAPIARPVVMTFFPSDDLSPALALELHALVEARLPFLARAGDADRLVYLPAAEVQSAATRAAASSFAAVDARWLTHGELYGALREQRLNAGVAYGTLRRMTPEELTASVVSYQDVLLLTRLPNDLPLVGGTITEELQTPLAHVNVAARARGTPNLALLGASEHPDIAPLIGALVRFAVDDDGWSIAAATLEEAETFWRSRARPPFSPPFDLTRDGLPGFDALGFAASPSVGVKAANLSELHMLLPDAAPDGFAIPFVHYDRFMRTTPVFAAQCRDASEDCLEEGRAPAVCEAARALCVPPAPETLAEHAARLVADPGFRGDTALREASLDALRWLVRHAPVAADFARALDAEVVRRFGDAPVRLRSSTNAEDLEDFSGAGLYDSYGARGTSDPASEEVRKVWASVWNWRAFEERTYWNIDHLAVRMGVAVHPAFPDERCNGVMVTRNLADPTVAGYYVNVQAGEVAVTNPADGAVPEVFTIVERPGGGVQVIRQRFSSLSPDAPLMSDAEVRQLFLAARATQQHFAALYGQSPYDFALDLEFKLHGPARDLIIKQARPYADPP